MVNLYQNTQTLCVPLRFDSYVRERLMYNCTYEQVHSLLHEHVKYFYVQNKGEVQRRKDKKPYQTHHILIPMDNNWLNLTVQLDSTSGYQVKRAHITTDFIPETEMEQAEFRCVDAVKYEINLNFLTFYQRINTLPIEDDRIEGDKVRDIWNKYITAMYVLTLQKSNIWEIQSMKIFDKNKKIEIIISENSNLPNFIEFFEDRRKAFGKPDFAFLMPTDFANYQAEMEAVALRVGGTFDAQRGLIFKNEKPIYPDDFLNKKNEVWREIVGELYQWRLERNQQKMVFRVNEKLLKRMEEEDFHLNDLKHAFITPIFRSDLAQIERMQEAMQLVLEKFPKQGRYNVVLQNPNFRKVLFNAQAARLPDTAEVQINPWQNPYLNERQKEAICKALNSKDLFLLQGPPGTGKTTVIAELVHQTVHQDQKQIVLIASQSNLAVDNALERLAKGGGIRPLRLGRAVRLEEEGLKYAQDRFQKWERGEQNSEDNAVAWQVNRLQQNAHASEKEFKEPIERWKKKLSNLKQVEKSYFTNAYLQHVNVVAATCMESGAPSFKKLYGQSGIDLVIVDEASKATPPELLLPLVLAKKAVIIGDHRQLPPMIDEKDFAEAMREAGAEALAKEFMENEAFKVSLFEQLFQQAKQYERADLTVTLTEQFRMHRQIMDVINPFYEQDGGLQVAEVFQEQMDVPDLNIRLSRHHGIEAGWLSSNKHCVFIDVETPEIQRGTSFYNQGEVDVIEKCLQKWADNPSFQAFQNHWKKEEEQEIGVISFYGAQLATLRDKPFAAPTRTQTVDKFQGMERNIVFVSLVRSHERQEETVLMAKSPPRKNRTLGFATDYKRINVAFSRARRLLVIVGNARHFQQDEQYNRIIDSLKRKGCFFKANQI